jgi:serine/threonine protein kinase
VQPPSNDFLAEPFIDCLKEPEALDGVSPELIASIQRFEASLSAEPKLPVRTAEWSATSELGRGDSSVVRLVREPEGTLSAVKSPETLRSVQLIKREAAIHRELKHPLIVEFRERSRRMFDPTTTSVTEVVENGSLASHLPSA